jgi:uncharacterized RDD family membrane protein YckC
LRLKPTEEELAELVVVPRSQRVPLTVRDQPAPANQYAGFWRRALADTVDVWLLLVAQCALFQPAATVAILYVMAPKYITPFLNDPFGRVVAGLFVIIALVGVALPWLYTAGLESSKHQATLGKHLFGLKVTDLNGANIGFFKSSMKLLVVALLTFPPIWIAQGIALLLEWKVVPQNASTAIISVVLSLLGALIPVFCTLYMLCNERKQTVFDKVTKRLVVVSAKPNLKNVAICMVICALAYGVEFGIGKYAVAVAATQSHSAQVNTDATPVKHKTVPKTKASPR